MATALLTLLSLSTLALRYQRQSINGMSAARVTEMVLNRYVAEVLLEDQEPPGPIETNFFDNDFSYPATHYRRSVEEGSAFVGREEFHWAIYATTVPGIGSTTDPDNPNRLKKVDAYVWWDTGTGQKRYFATRLVSQGEEP